MNHFLNTDDFSREEAYQLTMHYVRKMREKALISQQEYDAMVDHVVVHSKEDIRVVYRDDIEK